MIHGAGAEHLAAFKERAKQVVIDAWMRDDTPAALRAMYAVKTAEARMVISGGKSAFLEQEAALRDVPVLQLAALIAEMAEADQQREIRRVAIGLAIDAAEDHATVVAELEKAGLKLPDDRV